MSLSQIVVDQAAGAIAKYGSPVSVVNRTSTYDEQTGATTTVESTSEVKAVLDYNVHKVNGTPVTGKVYDVKAILPAADTAEVGDVLVVAGTRYTVQRVDPVWVMDQIATREVYGTRE